MRLKPGDTAPAFELPDLHGKLIRLSDFAGKRLLISFHRYAACPLCNLHIHELSQAWDELNSQGLEIVAIFMSGPQRVADQYESREVPFPILADPDRTAYGPYGVESSIPGMLASFVHPRAMKAFFSGFMPGKIDADTTAEFRTPDRRYVVFLQHHSAHAFGSHSKVCAEKSGLIIPESLT